MSSKTLVQQVLGLALVMFLAASCGGSATRPPPTSEAARDTLTPTRDLSTETPTLVSPTATVVPVAPTPTLIPVIPTLTPIVILRTATLTPAPPTPTLTLAPPPPPTDGGQIAFVSDRDGNREVYVMNADGSGLANLTNHQADDNWPTMSPDGSQVAFISNRDDPRRATCSLDLSCNAEIYVLRTDGSSLNRLTDTAGQEMFPAWSPEGSQIAFMRAYDMFVMDVDGSNQINLTGDSAGNLYPSWLPDGQRIIFLSLRDGGFQFYSVKTDGSGLTMLDSGLPPSEHLPGRFGIYLFEDGEIWIGGGGSMEAIRDSGMALGECPTWSPDGTQIAFHSSRDGNKEIYVMNADGSGLTRLTDNAASDLRPAWSPDGTRIAFSSNRDGNMEIYVMGSSGSNPTNLTNNLAEDTNAAWHP